MLVGHLWPPSLGDLITPLLSFIMVIVNVIMLILNKTNTLDVDIFDIWIYRIVGYLLFLWRKLNNCNNISYFIGVLKIINSDLMKPRLTIYLTPRYKSYDYHAYELYDESNHYGF